MPCRLIRKKSLAHNPMDSTKRLATKTAGPTTRMKTNKITARPVLAWLRYLMPLLTPLTAEKVKMAVTSAMMTTCVVLLTGMPHSMFTPLLTWRAPRPREVVVPKRVEKTARMSIALPIGPSTLSPRSGRKSWLTRQERPLR